MGYIAQIVAVDPASLREWFMSRSRNDLTAAAAAMLELQGLEDAGLAPQVVADLLHDSIERQPIDAPPRRAEGSSTALYLILDALTRNWSPSYSESWNGYFEALQLLAGVMPQWANLLQSSLNRGLFGLEGEDLQPCCGWISPEEIGLALPTFIDARKDGYLAALQSGMNQKPWYALRDDLHMCAQNGGWMIHSYG